MENPYDFIRPVRDPAMFFGRTQLLREILDGVRAGHSCAITGNTRIGKSSLLFRLRHTLLEQQEQSGHDAIVPVLVRKRDFPNPTPSIICRRIADQFQTVLDPADSGEDWQRGVRLFDPQLDDDDAVGVFGEALETIARMHRTDCRIVLLLDDMDRLSGYRWSHIFFEQLRQLIMTPNGIRMTVVVADSVFPPSNSNARAPLLESVRVKTVGVLSQSATVELITKPTGLERASPIVSSIVNETGGHPFLVQYLMHQLFEVASGDLARATQQDLDAIVTRYYDERSDFSPWAARFTHADHRAYDLIASGPGTTRADLQRELGDADQTSRAIAVLLQTGVVRAESPDSDRYRASGEMFRRWVFDRRRRLEPQATQAGPTVLRSAAEPRRPSDEVQFTVYRPNVLRPGEWKTMLAFMHLANRRPDAPRDEPSPVEQVQALARQTLGRQASHYDHDRTDARSSVPRESEITLVPLVQGLEFRPGRRSFLWVDDVHQEQFTVRALPEADRTIARGRLSAFLGVILLAEVDISIRVDSAHPAGDNDAPKESSTAKLYRRVFASYSRRDSEVVRQFELFVQSLGDVYLRDVHDIKPGMDWRTRLRELIQEADVFQLFWSHNAMQSPHVRAEWEYALSLNRPGFVRPTYWEDPFPESPADGLPPEELRRLHFYRLGRSPSRMGHAEFETELVAQSEGKLVVNRTDDMLSEPAMIVVPAESPPLRDVLAPVAVTPGAASGPQPLPRPESAPRALRAPRSNWLYILVAFAVLASLGLTFVFFFLD